MTSCVVIDDLRECLHFADIVADRIWREWWADDRAYPHIQAKVRNSATGTAFPFTLVAHRDGEFLGTVSVVESNMEPRRDLSPWLSALWVEENYRAIGIGAALVAAAVEKTNATGRYPVYLMATIDRVPFYGKRGWREVPPLNAFAGQQLLQFSFIPLV